MPLYTATRSETEDTRPVTEPIEGTSTVQQAAPVAAHKQTLARRARKHVMKWRLLYIVRKFVTFPAPRHLFQLLGPVQLYFTLLSCPAPKNERTNLYKPKIQGYTNERGAVERNSLSLAMPVDAKELWPVDAVRAKVEAYDAKLAATKDTAASREAAWDKNKQAAEEEKAAGQKAKFAAEVAAAKEQVEQSATNQAAYQQQSAANKAAAEEKASQHKQVRQGLLLLTANNLLLSQSSFSPRVCPVFLSNFPSCV